MIGPKIIETNHTVEIETLTETTLRTISPTMTAGEIGQTLTTDQKIINLLRVRKEILTAVIHVLGLIMSQNHPTHLVTPVLEMVQRLKNWMLGY